MGRCNSDPTMSERLNIRFRSSEGEICVSVAPEDDIVSIAREALHIPHRRGKLRVVFAGEELGVGSFAEYEIDEYAMLEVFWESIPLDLEEDHGTYRGEARSEDWNATA